MEQIEVVEPPAGGENSDEAPELEYVEEVTSGSEIEGESEGVEAVEAVEECQHRANVSAYLPCIPTHVPVTVFAYVEWRAGSQT